MNRECAGTITSTGNNAVVPSSSGIRFGGNHKSHWAASPGAHTSRSAGSGRRCSGRSRATFSRNHDGDPDQPTRSASTVAGISGNSASIARTRSSNGVNDVASAGARSYFGGSLDATARATVFREIPNRSAIRVFGTPSAANLRINAQSSKVITLQSLSAHFSTGRDAQFSAVTDTRRVANPTRLAYPAFRGRFNRRSGSRSWDACSAWLYDVALQPEPHSGRSLGATRLSLARGVEELFDVSRVPRATPEQVGVPCPRISCCCGAGKRATG